MSAFDPLKPGDVIRTTGFKHEYLGDAHLQLTYKAPKKKIFILMLLGVEEKDGSVPLNPEEAIHRLGWKVADE